MAAEFRVVGVSQIRTQSAGQAPGGGPTVYCLLCIGSHHLHGRGEKKKVHIDTSLLSFEGFNNRQVKGQLLLDLIDKFD